MSRSRFGIAALLFTLAIAYASTIIGPVGPNFVPRDPYEAWHRLLHIHYFENGSDQRADWMGNLTMLVPLGVLLAGWFLPRRRAPAQMFLGAIGALATSVAIILAIKYLQLFFPPRTVTLNYVVAQIVGAATGILLFCALRTPLAAAAGNIGRLESLRAVLCIYAGVLLVFLLAPLDFALGRNDLTEQFARLPASFTAISGEGRPGVVRAAVILGSIAAMIPVGMLLTFFARGGDYVGRSIGAATGIGLCAMLIVYGLTALLISGSPSLPAVGFRTFGIAIGAGCIHWLARQNPDRLRRDLGRFVPWLVPVYLISLAAVNGLLSPDWTTPERAAEDFYPLGLFPLFNYYIVTKAQAAKNIVAHAVMYAPIGIMIWALAKHGSGRTLAFVVAALLSSTVEAGRFLRPGLVPDINAIPLAGVAAWVAIAAMPGVWRMVATIAHGGPVAMPWPGLAADVPTE